MEHKREKRNAEIDKICEVGLFSDDEIKKIRLGPDFKEASLSKMIKSDDFEFYIKKETEEVELIIERLKTHQNTETSVELINVFGKKLQVLYKVAISRYPEELRLWDAYMAFSRKYKYKGEFSLSLKNMLNTHANNPEAWMRAISWEYEDMQNIKLARNYYFCGLQKNPESQLLFVNFVKLELKEGAQAPEENDNDRDLALQRAVLVYDMAKNKIKALPFLVKMLHTVQDYPFADSLTENIIRDMEVSYARNELLWHTLAQRELMGYHRIGGDIYPEDYDKDEITPKNVPRKRKLRARIEICVQVYEVATETLKTEMMWSYFINEMMILNQDLSTESNLKRNSLMRAFKGAHNANLMTVDQYCDFLKLLMESEKYDDYFRSVIKFATRKYKDASKLWATWLQFRLRRMKSVRIAYGYGRHL